MHKESSPFRITKDEETVEAMTKVIVERMKYPFMIEEGTNEDNRQPLINIFTKPTAPQDVTDCLLKVRQYGQQALENFVRSSRLNNQEIDLFDTLPKRKLKTFASVNKTGNKVEGENTNSKCQ